MPDVLKSIVQPDGEIVYFTVDEANKMIPQLNATFIRLRQIQHQIKVRFEQVRALDYLNDDAIELLLMHEELDEQAFDDLSSIKVLLLQMQQEVNQLSGKGCKVINLSKGIVNWTARLKDRDVLLSWRVGERYVGFSHEHEKHDERQPLSQLIADE